MPNFTYTARSQNGDLKTATIEAASKEDVVAQLRRQRLSVVKVDDAGVTVRNAKGDERVVEADSVVLASGAAPAHALLHEFEWMVDELHGVGDALIPRGLEQAIQDGFRLGVRL